MKFNQNKYISEYAKSTYKDIKFRVRKDDTELLEYLDTKENISSYIRGLIADDLQKNKNYKINGKLDKNQLKRLLNKIIIVINNDKEIKEMWLFGSYAYGNPNDKSDIDLAFVVDTKKTNAVKSGEIAYKLKKIFEKYDLSRDILCFKENEKIESKNKLSSFVDVGTDIFNKGVKIFERTK